MDEEEPMMLESTVSDHNRRFFARHEVMLRQLHATDGQPFRFLSDSSEDAVLKPTNKEIKGSTRRAELTLSTPGHEWFLLEDWVDDLHEWLGKIIEARKKP
jgi:hypothetical protein